MLFWWMFTMLFDIFSLEIINHNNLVSLGIWQIVKLTPLISPLVLARKLWKADFQLPWRERLNLQFLGSRCIRNILSIKVYEKKISSNYTKLHSLSMRIINQVPYNVHCIYQLINWDSICSENYTFISLKVRTLMLMRQQKRIHIHIEPVSQAHNRESDEIPG